MKPNILDINLECTHLINGNVNLAYLTSNCLCLSIMRGVLCCENKIILFNMLDKNIFLFYNLLYWVFDHNIFLLHSGSRIPPCSVLGIFKKGCSAFRKTYEKPRSAL